MDRAARLDLSKLRRLGSLASFSDSQLESLAGVMETRKINRKEKIFSQGEKADRLYLLASGIVRLSLVNQEERRVLVSILPPGEFFGTACLFPERRHPFSGEAFTDCTVGIVTADSFVRTFLGVPLEAYLRCTQLTMGQVWKMFLRCIGGIGLTLRKRLALELLELAASFGVEDSRGTILSARPTHEDLANSIGASRQKVTETLTDFERHRVVIRDGRRLILRTRKLREIVEKG